MTENEVIKKLEPYLDGIDSDLTFMELFYKDVDRSEYLADRDAFKTAITALKAIQQYREIGTVEECREAVEKQKPKAPDYEGDGYADGYMVYDTWICPNCGKKYEVDYDDYKHCPNCGQAIDENLEGIEDEQL